MYGGQYGDGPYRGGHGYPPGPGYGQGYNGQGYEAGQVPVEDGGFDGVNEYYQYSQFAPVRRSGRGRRLAVLGLIGALLLVVGYLAYTKVYVPRFQHPVAAGAAPVAQFTAGAPSAAVPSAASSSSVSSSATTPPTLAWAPWLASDGGKAFRAMEIGDTTLVDARQKAQAALQSGKNIPSAGTVLAKAAAAELTAVATARTAPLPPRVAQPAWAKAMAELTQGSSQLATAAKAMQGGNKQAASRAIAASMPSMNAAFDDLSAVQEKIPAP